MKISLSLVETENQIRENILKSLGSDIDNALNKSSNNIQNQIQNLLKQVIVSQPEYSSLKNGRLRLDFGIPDVSVVDDTIDAIISTTKTTVKKTQISKNGLSGGLSIEFLNKDELSSITQSSSAMVQDRKGYSIPWLQWLLYEGIKPVVKLYSIKLGPSRTSRTGMAIMVRSNENWSVTPQFAGTVNNNWITRAIDDLDDKKILSIIEQEINKNI